MADLQSKKDGGLRQRAETSLKRIVTKSLPGLQPHDVEALVHELRVHQIELELQCQDLQAAQADAERSRNRYRELYESIPIGYVMIDPGGRIVDLNPAGVDLLGETADTPASTNFNGFLAGQDVDRFTLFCREVVRTKTPQTGEFKMKRVDGGLFFAWLQAVPVRAGEGQGEQLRIAFKDITQRKKAEEILRRHEAESTSARVLAERQLLVSSLRLDSILQSAMDAIITVDNKQRVLLFNQAAEEMFRCPAAHAMGQSIDQFVPARFQEAHRHHVENFGHSDVTSRKMGRLGTVTGFRADGTEFPVEASISHIIVEGKMFFTVILRDITERTRLEEQLRRTERVAELGTLASGMAHEIGTPMNVILGRAEYLMDRVSEEPVKKSLKTIITQVERITRVMNQLLSFARRKPLQPGPLAMQEVIENSLEMFQQRLSKQGVQVSMQVDHDCPTVQADSDQMNQVLINLIMNAVQAMPDGGTLRIGLGQERDSVKLTISDTGHGIPKEVVNKIFDPFFTTKEFGKGTGLGLTVVKGIIEEHHGTITVESQEGKGTAFTLVLPEADSR